MRALREVGAQELAWVQRKRFFSIFSKEHELFAGDAKVAFLRYNILGHAEAETAEGKWLFKNVGFLRREVIVLPPWVKSEIIRVSLLGWMARRATVEFEGGRRFYWDGMTFRNDSKQPIVQCLRFSHLFQPKVVGTVEVKPAALSVPELSLLVVLGWYLTIYYQYRGSGGA